MTSQPRGLPHMTSAKTGKSDHKIPQIFGQAVYKKWKRRGMVSKNLDILQTSFMEALSSAFLLAFASVRPSVAFVALRRFGWQRNELSPPTDRWRRELDGWMWIKHIISCVASWFSRWLKSESDTWFVRSSTSWHDLLKSCWMKICGLGLSYTISVGLPHATAYLLHQS